MVYVNYNGTLIPDDRPFLKRTNRSFRYGDGIFESIRKVNGQFPLWEHHIERLRKGANLLQLSHRYLTDETSLLREIQKTSKWLPYARIRLSFFREDGGLYTPVSNNAEFLIEAETMTDPQFSLNDIGYTIGICTTVHVNANDPFSNIKSCNSLPYVLAGLFKKRNQLDDCLLLNQQMNLVEGSASNLFIYKEKQLITPPLSEGCLDGVMRKVLIELAQSLDIPIVEQPLNAGDLRTAEEVMLTNAIQGIRWVKRFGDKTYGHELAGQLTQEMNKRCLAKVAAANG